MNVNAKNFQDTCIEYLKTQNPNTTNDEIRTILSRSDIEILKTTVFHNSSIWNQREINIELRVPIPLFNRAVELKSEINSIFRTVFPTTNDYIYAKLMIKPKIFGTDELHYNEHDVIFDNIEKTIIQGIRDAKYLIWIAVGWFSSEKIFVELEKRKADGIDIRILTIGNKSNKTMLEDLKLTFNTIGIILPGSHIFHHKFCIIDLEYVMHGSYNWSKNAKSNAETWSTALDRDYAKKFADKFMQMYKTHKFCDEDLLPINNEAKG